MDCEYERFELNQPFFRSHYCHLRLRFLVFSSLAPIFLSVGHFQALTVPVKNIRFSSADMYRMQNLGVLCLKITEQV